MYIQASKIELLDKIKNHRMRNFSNLCNFGYHRKITLVGRGRHKMGPQGNLLETPRSRTTVVKIEDHRKRVHIKQITLVSKVLTLTLWACKTRRLSLMQFILVYYVVVVSNCTHLCSTVQVCVKELVAYQSICHPPPPGHGSLNWLSVFCCVLLLARSQTWRKTLTDQPK